MKYRIAENFLPVQRYLKQHRGRKCRKTCNGCETDWRETGTAFVHLAIRQEPPELGKKYYLCDNCLPSFKP